MNEPPEYPQEMTKEEKEEIRRFLVSVAMAKRPCTSMERIQAISALVALGELRDD